MLDLSAAFDTIDHDILFSRMENTLGITGQALGDPGHCLHGRPDTSHGGKHKQGQNAWTES